MFFFLPSKLLIVFLIKSIVFLFLECFFVNGTFNSDVTLKAPLESNNLTFKCVANTSRLEDIEVTIKTQNDIVTGRYYRAYLRFLKDDLCATFES